MVPAHAARYHGGMAARGEAVVGEELELTTRFLRGGVPYDPYEIVRVELIDSSLYVVATTEDVTAGEDAGTYSVTFPSVERAGDYADRWYFRLSDGGEILTQANVVSVEGVGTVPLPDDSAAVPDAGEGAVCYITARFFTADGRARRGVMAQFVPTYDPEQLFAPRATLMVPVYAESAADGTIRFPLLRGLVGVLSISHTPVAREVTVPDQAEVALEDLLASTYDPLTVQRPPTRYTLPRTT